MPADTKKISELTALTTPAVDDLFVIVDTSATATKSIRKDVLQKRYDVTHYGAVGDGTTDDTAVIQATITACEAAADGHVWVPAGFYRTSSPLSVTRELLILGEGRSAYGAAPRPISVIWSYGEGNGITFAPTDTGQTLHIEHIGLADMIHATRIAGDGIYASRTGNNCHVYLRDVFVEWFINGVTLVRPTLSSVEQVKVRNCDNHGIRLVGDGVANGGTSTQIRDCFASACGAAGYYAEGMVYTNYIGCATDACVYGYQLEALSHSTTGISYFGCGCESPTADCMRFEDVIGINVVGGRYISAGSDAIHVVDDVDGLVITALLQNSTDYGLRVDGAPGTVYSGIWHCATFINSGIADILDTPGIVRRFGDVATSGVTASRPGDPMTGQTYFDTTLGQPIWYTGAAWVDADGVPA